MGRDIGGYSSLYNNYVRHKFVESISGIGVLRNLNKILKDLGVGRILILVSKSVWMKDYVRQSLSTLLDFVSRASVKPVSVSNNSLRSLLESDIVEDIDSYGAIIAIGGGSVIDLGKYLRILSSSPVSDPFEYLPKPYGSNRSIMKELKPFIAVPTTAGSGSEASPVSVLSVTSTKKIRVVSDYLRPTLAVLDPLLTISMPRRQTVISGLDALMHALESYTAKSYYELKPGDNLVFQGSTTITKTLSLGALRHILSYLPRAVSNPSDIDARSKMLVAAHIAGLAFSITGNHLSHAISYALTSIAAEKGKMLAHGEAVALTGPGMLRVLEKYGTSIDMDLKNVFNSYAPSPNNDSNKHSIACSMAGFLNSLGFPYGLRYYGFTINDFANIVELSLKEHGLLAISPLEVSRELIMEILEYSYDYSRVCGM